LIKKNNESAKLFEENKEQFGIETIRDYIKISQKIELSRELLRKHHNILPIFSYLETRTLEDVILSDLSLAENGDYIAVKASGKAPVLSDLQLQSRSYAENKNVSELVLSNITKSREGYSVFDLNFSVHKKFLTERSF
jgi:phage anti-repressor protein